MQTGSQVKQLWEDVIRLTVPWKTPLNAFWFADSNAMTLKVSKTVKWNKNKSEKKNWRSANIHINPLPQNIHVAS